MLTRLTAALSRDTNLLVQTIGYVKARLAERSTYAGLVAAIGGGCAFAAPWSFLAVACGVIAVFVPESGKANG